MNLHFKREWTEERQGESNRSLAEVIDSEIRNAARLGDDDTTIEARRIERLTDIVKKLAELLPEKLQEELVIGLNREWQVDNDW